MIKVNSTNTAAVDQSHFWIPVDHIHPPVGVKVLVINRHHGVACLSTWRNDDKWTHWQALPKFPD